MITLRPAAMESGLTYAKVLADAKDRIDLGTLGVPPLKMRMAASGARILEVPGAEKTQKADSLANRLREIFVGTEGVQISRPVATADLRVSGLDDSVTLVELTRALAGAGDCPETAFKIGDISRGPARMGKVFVRCPVTVARRIVAGRRLPVGWVSAQVQLLDARPRRCFRCLAPGHIRSQCRSEVDRSGQCYRCGQEGHKAKECSAAPRCTLCAAAGKAANHLSGSKTCTKHPVPPGRCRKLIVDGDRPKQLQPMPANQY